ncbi:MAG: glycosyltransferase family 1 protein [Ignavibacteria bacterium]|nr:MAG: glycosyltransferase family 1 protein [Ignavibacteria bacterium]
MRIIYHHRTLGDGAEGIHIREMVNALRKLGNDIKLVSLVTERELIHPDRRSAKPKWLWVKQLLPSALFEVLEIIYNVIGYWLIIKASKKFHPDAVYDRYVSYNYSAIWASRKLGIPCILEVNSPYATQRKIWEKVYFPKLIQWFETKITNSADKVIVVSSALKKHLVEHGTFPGKIIVMPNGVDPDKFDLHVSVEKFRNKYCLSAKDTVLGFVGVFRKWHNIEMLLEVFQKLKPVKRSLKMIFVGDGEIQMELEEQARSLGVEGSVIFTGRIPHKDMAGHIALFDIAISPHVTYYSCPMKILEYMAMGKCVLAPDMQNIRDLIQPGETGYLFKPKDKEDLLKKLKYLITHREERERVGRAAAEKIRNNYTWEKNAEQVVQLFLDLIQQKNQKLVDTVKIIHNKT